MQFKSGKHISLGDKQVDVYHFVTFQKCSKVSFKMNPKQNGKTIN